MIKRMKRLLDKRNSKGFTLVEVIVSTALLGVLIIGILIFMTPVFSNVHGGIEIERANRVGTTMNQYISKSIKNASFMKVYTNASVSDADDISDTIITDPDYINMMKFVEKANSSGGAGSTIDSYRVACIAIKYVQDTNPRHSTSGLPSHKYVITKETTVAGAPISGTSTPSYLIDTSKSQQVFEMCFYEKLYPEVTFERLEVNIAGAGEPAKMVGPAYRTIIRMYDEEFNPALDPTTRTHALLFEGKGITELNNVKSLQINPKGEKHLTYPNMNIGTGNDTLIFFVVRDHVVVATPPATP